MVIKWRYRTTPSSVRERGWSVLLKFPMFIPIPPPAEVTIILNHVTIIHLLFFIALQMCLTQNIVWFSLLDWIGMESYCIYFSVICFFHSRLCFWDLSIWCVHTDIFNLAKASLSSSYITLIQSKLNFILWATSCLFTFINNNVWLYHKSSIYGLG